MVEICVPVLGSLWPLLVSVSISVTWPGWVQGHQAALGRPSRRHQLQGCVLSPWHQAKAGWPRLLSPDR